MFKKIGKLTIIYRNNVILKEKTNFLKKLMKIQKKSLEKIGKFEIKFGKF